MHQQTQHLHAVRATAASRLMIWSVASIVVGLAMWFGPMGADYPRTVVFIRAAGSQFAIWGAIDAVFALMGMLQARTPLPDSEELAAGQKLIGALRFNRWLNWAWVISGAALLVAGLVNHSIALDGHGIGVLIQGGFLFCFDRTFLAKLLKAMETKAQ